MSAKKAKQNSADNLGKNRKYYQINHAGNRVIISVSIDGHGFPPEYTSITEFIHAFNTLCNPAMAEILENIYTSICASKIADIDSRNRTVLTVETNIGIIYTIIMPQNIYTDICATITDEHTALAYVVFVLCTLHDTGKLQIVNETTHIKGDN